ncbi:hypothetical protein GGF46_001241 [Coemansia sp. RSA 552]|nr:hypothetical protein GGF46_001241 [Coemansia sp. RSA 552]
MVGLKTVAMAALGALPAVLAHSWVDCVKYDPVNQLCEGYPRGYPGRDNPKTNTVFTYLFSGSPKSQKMCNPNQQSTMNYSEKYPMARVQPGETIYTTWEQNGHPDGPKPTKVDILYYPDTNHQFADVSERDTAMVAGTMDFATANCYNMADPNTACFGSWTVPKDLVPGKTYHFVWFWYFNQNPAGEWYSTCFDLDVQTSSHVVQSKPMPQLLAIGEPDIAYALGFTDQVKAQVADVTSLSGNAVAGTPAYGAGQPSVPASEPPAMVPNPSVPQVQEPQVPEPPAMVPNPSVPQIQEPQVPEPQVPQPPPPMSSPLKCIPRPTY